jgi:hypothetical protein
MNQDRIGAGPWWIRQGDMYNTKFSIGEVEFAEPCEKNSAGFRHVWKVGDERVALLQRVRDGKALPEPLFLIASHGCGGWRRITPDEINWETSRIRPSPQG